VLGAILAQDDGQACHTFPADHADLKVSLAWAVRHHGCKSVIDEINRLDPAVGCLQGHQKRQIDGLEVRSQKGEIGA
jgi:hypothetical protein